MLWAASATSGSSTIAALGFGDVGVGAADDGAWVDAAEDVEQRPRRGHDVVQRREDRRLLDALADRAAIVAAQVERDGAEPPGDEQPEPDQDDRAAEAVERPERAPRPGRPQRVRDAVEGDREEGADEDPGRDGDERRVLGLRAAVEQLRPDPGTERRPADEAGERQGAGEQAALVSDRREGEHEDDDPDVH